jgi:AraC family transcriptional regulator of adaptative response/methylated-DNA-[protein]-cysteine methyltransferase
LGWVIVAATERGICAVEFGDDDRKLLDYIRERFPKAGFEKGGAGYISLLKRVVEYAEHPN